MEELYQVNVFTSVDDKSNAYITRYSEDGYKGVTVGTVYSDGYDTTNWCVFVGTKLECEEYAQKLNETF